LRLRNVILVLVAVAFAAWVIGSLMRVEPVVVLESNLSRSGDSVSVAGKLKNTGSDSGPLDVEIRYYDPSGKSLAVDHVSINTLKAGDELNFHTTPRPIAEASQFSIYLNHGRNPYGN
jgi:hypothetical protein